MASNYTTNYNLCQWQPTDQVQRTDFNADNAKIDAALKTNADAIAAETAARTAAVALCGNCKIVYGSYTGTGKYDVQAKSTLSFSGQPLLVIIQNGASVGTLLMIRGSTRAFLSANIGESIASIVPEWNTLNTVTWYAGSAQLQMNVKGTSYHYVALLAADD